MARLDCPASTSATTAGTNGHTTQAEIDRMSPDDGLAVGLRGGGVADGLIALRRVSGGRVVRRCRGVAALHRRRGVAIARGRRRRSGPSVGGGRRGVSGVVACGRRTRRAAVRASRPGLDNPRAARAPLAPLRPARTAVVVRGRPGAARWCPAALRRLAAPSAGVPATGASGDGCSGESGVRALSSVGSGGPGCSDTPLILARRTMPAPAQPRGCPPPWPGNASGAVGPSWSHRP